MKRCALLILITVLLATLSRAASPPVDLKTGTSSPSPAPARSGLAVEVDVSGESGDVFQRGSAINVSFRTDRDAFVVVYNIDSEGYVHLLHPVDGKPVRTEGRTTHYLPEPGSGVVWETSGKTGIEYIHAVAVEDESLLNEDELYFLSRSERMSQDKRLRIDMDPGLAFNMIDEEIVRDATQNAPATDYARFYINRRVDYPRYICAKCHSPEKISDPYAMECPETDIASAGSDEGLGYPYASLYDVREDAGGDQSGAVDYASVRYEDDAGDEDEVDTHVYLSLGYGLYDPYYGGWGFSFGWGDPYFYWGFGWGYPYYGWGYPSYGYPYYGCGGYYYPCGYYGYPYYDYYYPIHYRSSYSDRDVTKRKIDYQNTAREMSRSKSIENTRLARSKTEESARRLGRSDLARQSGDRNRSNLQRQATERNRSLFRQQTSERNRSSGAVTRSGRSSSRGSDLQKGLNRAGDRLERESEGVSRSGKSASQRIDRQWNRMSRDMQRRESAKAADRSSKGGSGKGDAPAVQPSRPDGGSGKTRSSSAPPPRSGSSTSRGGASSGRSGASHGSGGGGKTRTR